MLTGGSFWWVCDGLLLAFATPSTLAADAAVIVSQSPGAAQTNLLEPIARTIESTIALPLARRTVCVITRLLVNGIREVVREGRLHMLESVGTCRHVVMTPNTATTPW